MSGLEMNGMSELLKKLEKMGSRSQRVKREALLEGAKIMKQTIEQNAPKRTGKLADNIVISDVNNDETVDIGPDQQGTAFYGHFLEFGTSKMPAQPFVEPSFHQSKEAAQDKMASVIKRELGL